jgi:hypothetical protein
MTEGRSVGLELSGYDNIRWHLSDIGLDDKWYLDESLSGSRLKIWFFVGIY